jgi:TPR repeat protein
MRQVKGPRAKMLAVMILILSLVLPLRSMAITPAIPARSLVIHLHGSPRPVFEAMREVAISLGMECTDENIKRECWTKPSAHPEGVGSIWVSEFPEGRTVGIAAHTAVNASVLYPEVAQALDQLMIVISKNPDVDIEYVEECRGLNECFIAKEQMAAVRRRAAAGDSHLQNVWGDWLCDGQYGLQTNYHEAAKWYRRASKQGNQDAEVSLGALYESGLGVPKDHDRALEWIRRGTPSKDDANSFPFDYSLASVALNIGSGYRYGSINGRQKVGGCFLSFPKDVLRAMRWFHISYEAGRIAHQTRGSFIVAARALGALSESEPSMQNLAEAIDWYEIAAGYGDGPAMMNLGRIYADGDGAPQDYALSVFWYRQAVEHGVRLSNYELARFYERGLGVDQDVSRAFELYYSVPGSEDSRQRLINIASAKLGYSLGDNESIEQNRREAANGNAWAQVALGLRYERGLGVPARRYTALALYKVASTSVSNGARAPDLVPWLGPDRSQWRERQDADSLRFAAEMSRPGNFLAALDNSVANPPVE